MIERRWIISLFELLKAHRNLFELNQIAFIFLYYKFSCYSLSKKSVPGLRIFHYDNDYDNVKYVLLLEKKNPNSTQPEKKINLNLTFTERKLKQLWIFLPVKLSLFEITSCIYEFFPLQNFPYKVIHFEWMIKWIFLPGYGLLTSGPLLLSN